MKGCQRLPASIRAQAGSQALAHLRQRSAVSASVHVSAIAVTPISTTTVSPTNSPFSPRLFSSSSSAHAKLKTLPRSKLVQRARAVQAKIEQGALLSDNEFTEVPEGVTPEFFNLYQAFLSDLETAQPDVSGLRLLAYEVKNPKDAEFFKTALFRWRKHEKPQLPYTQADILVIVDSFLSARAHTALLELACNRKRYGVYLSEEQLLILMRRFREEAESASPHLQNAEEGASEETHIEALNNLYKTFALLLYAYIPPSSEAYSLLITTGVYGGTPEGWRRSLITAKEQASLGLPFMGEAADALAVGYLKQGNATDAAKYLRRDLVLIAAGQPRRDVSVGKESMLLAIDVYTKVGDLQKAVNALEYLAANSLEETKPYGSAYWGAEEDILKDLKEACVGNEAYAGRVEVAISTLKK
ncbi:hypothetical protein HDV05_006418 [Chytridiales sp. JEL 0842]|nr:hypothetical protein HDV05_006418 [Chytridiales sp. JEL 0842]